MCRWGRASHAMAIADLIGGARAARRREVRPAEERVVQMVNNAPDRLIVPVWVVIQGGR